LFAVQRNHGKNRKIPKERKNTERTELLDLYPDDPELCQLSWQDGEI